MYDVAAIGEVLIDFTPDGVNDQELRGLRGTRAARRRMLAMNAKLGGRTAFIGKVGRMTSENSWWMS